MSSLLVFHKVYRLEIKSVMLVFSTQVCAVLPRYPLSGSPPPPPPPLPKVQRTVYTDHHILKEFNTMFLKPLQVNIF
jgi:hypothetical protein